MQTEHTGLGKADIRHIAGALAAGFAVHAWFILHHPPVGGDALLYGDLARNMLQHHKYGFTEDEGIRSTLIRLPGYPIFLAAFFVLFGVLNFSPVLWFQVLLDLATCYLVASMTARLMGRRAGLAALWFSAICPFTALYSAVALTECGCLFFVALAFYALERWLRQGSLRWAATIGLALIGGIVLRPDQALVAVAIVPIMLWTGFRPGLEGGFSPLSRGTKREGALAPGSLLQATKSAALVSLIIALPLCLWAVRNYRVFHVLQPLAPRYANDPGEANPYGFQRWFRTWALDFKATVDVYWTYDGSEVRLQDLPGRAFDNEAQRIETAKLYAEYAAAGASTPHLDAEFAQLAAQRIHDHPFRYYLLLPFGRLLDMWLRPRTEWTKIPIDWWNFRAHESGSWKALGYAAVNLVYLILAGLGWWSWHRHKDAGMQPLMLAMMAFVLLRCALLMTLDNCEMRYTLECFPIVFALAGMFFASPCEAE